MPHEAVTAGTKKDRECAASTYGWLGRPAAKILAVPCVNVK
jgi:hypothetical protein